MTRPIAVVRYLSVVMVGLDPTIHRDAADVDPRVKPEDDVKGWEAVAYKQPSKQKRRP
jgi:hypothetical protein